ncbi:hypothetical protein G9P44_003159 [Scheffersomyces stipitis]|nr:hypothetical protein G9P44_003159 [Scheffersomyces stipitis]
MEIDNGSRVYISVDQHMIEMTEAVADARGQPPDGYPETEASCYMTLLALPDLSAQTGNTPF